MRILSGFACPSGLTLTRGFKGGFKTVPRKKREKRQSRFGLRFEMVPSLSATGAVRQSPDPTILAWLRIQQQDDLASYLTRGRQHALAPPEKLKDRWVALMREWAKNYTNFDHSERNDIQAELELRGIELPIELIPYAWSSLVESARKTVDASKNLDPETRERLDKKVSEELARVFGQNSKKN
jgi:hypothetical protein